MSDNWKRYASCLDQPNLQNHDIMGSALVVLATMLYTYVWGSGISVKCTRLESFMRTLAGAISYMFPHMHVQPCHGHPISGKQSSPSLEPYAHSECSPAIFGSSCRGLYRELQHPCKPTSDVPISSAHIPESRDFRGRGAIPEGRTQRGSTYPKA